MEMSDVSMKKYRKRI